jgi:RHS repeat-associated protein
LDWTVFNQVEQITQGSLSTTFRFGAGRERVVQEHSDGTKTIYIGELYELVTNTATGLTEEKYHVYSPLGKVATRTVRSDALIETRYHHLDALGSIVAVTDEWGRVEKRFAFDPWGKRDPLVDTHAGQGGKVTRGFTGHEHLDDFGLIHMNGRVFDPALGRFLSADPFVGDEGASQAYNRYSYVNNNPLNATDPSGYLSFDDVFRVVVVAIIVIAVAYSAGVAAGGLNTFWGATAAGAAGGFTGGFVGTLAYGGSLNDALKAGLIGGAIGAVTAGLTHVIGTAFNDASGIWANDYVNWTGRTLAHATVGGLASEAQGGEFRHGFYASAFSNGIMHLGGPQSGPLAGTGGVMGFMGGTEGGWYVAARTATAALIGGTAAELAGGKFVNGAATSAMQHLFNAEGSKANLRRRKNIDEIARSKNGSDLWAYDKKKDDFPANTNKCNKFVYDCIKETGADATVTVKDAKGNPVKRQPLASEWASKTTKIPGWRVLNPNEAPAPGDVTAYRLTGGGTRYTGHTGIMISDGAGGVTNISAHSDKVYTTKGQFENNVDTIYRRYTGE